MGCCRAPVPCADLEPAHRACYTRWAPGDSAPRQRVLHAARVSCDDDDSVILRLRHLAGSRAGTIDELPLEEGAELAVGRHPNNAICFDPDVDLAVSGVHAQFSACDGDLFVEDLGSSNGTLVNDERLRAPAKLAPGDVIAFGRSGPRVRFEPEGFEAALDVVVPKTQAMPALAAPPRSVGPRTVEIMIERATQRSSKRFGLVVLLLALLLLGAIAAIVLLTLSSREEAREQEAKLEQAQSELAKTSEKLERTQAEIADERQRLQAQNLSARLAQERAMRDQLAAARVEVSEEVRAEFERRQRELLESLTSVETRLTRTFGDTLFMLVVSPDTAAMRDKIGATPTPGRPGFDEGFCTAFAIHPDGWLATNAHCVDSIFSLRYDFARQGVPVRFFARRNGDSTTAYPLLVETARLHPRYTHAASPDVAIIKVDLAAAGQPSLRPVVSLAAGAQAESLEVGEPIYTLGFPGKVMNPYRVQADFRGGNVARLTDFESGDHGASGNQFVWHTALITKGTSGSPIFDRSGRVVAVNNGTMSAEQVVATDGSTQEVRYVYSADGLNFGVRVDVLEELLDEVGVTAALADEHVVPVMEAPAGELLPLDRESAGDTPHPAGAQPLLPPFGAKPPSSAVPPSDRPAWPRSP